MRVLLVFVVCIYFILADTPQQIFISLSGGKRNDIVVSWISTKYDENAIPTVRFGYASGAYEKYVFGKPRTWTCGKPVEKRFVVNEVHLENLMPGRKVFYSCSNNRNGTEWSTERWFISPQTSSKFHFIVYGDTGTNSGEFKKVVSMIASQYKESDPPRLMIHAGDMSYATSESQERWDIWGNNMEPITSKIPYMYAVGNHESPCGFVGYTERFSKLPGIKSGSNTNLWYSFDYSLVHFVMISSEHNYNATSEQLNWLIKDLQKVDRKVTPYVIAAAHKPMYSSNLGHMSDLKFRNAVEQTLIKYKTDIIWYGHVHAYERTCPVNNETCAEGNPVHAYAGTAGALYSPIWWFKPKWSKYREASHGYVNAWADPQQLTFQFVRLDGSVADEFVVKNKFLKK